MMGAKVIYQPRQVFGKAWSLEGYAIHMMDNGIRPLYPPSWDEEATDLAELSGGRGLAPTHAPEQQAQHSEDGGQVFPLVQRHPITGRESVFCHTLCMDRIELADGSRLGWEESQEFVAKVLGLLTRPCAVARVQWKPGTLAIFDNTAVVHAGTPPGPNPEATRVMHRISKVGEWIPQPALPAKQHSVAFGDRDTNGHASRLVVATPPKL